MTFLLDASSLIEAKDRYYAFDLCPGFWDCLVKHHADSRIFSIDRIKHELLRGNDELSVWTTRISMDFFLPPDDSTLAALGQITQWVMSGDFKPQGKDEFMRGADPFLIAHAMAYGHTVVTDEVPVIGQKNKVKIPAVCNQFGVTWCNLFEMLRRCGVTLVLP